MSALPTRPLLLALTLGLAAPLAAADTIHLVDGTKIEDVEVREDGLKLVRYDREELASAKVLRIEFSDFPTPVLEAQGLAAEGDVASAVLQLYYYVDASTSGRPERAEPWAPAWAAMRRVELLGSANDLAGTIEAADLLLEKFPESRHVPGAYLAKAEAQIRQGDNAAAVRTLGGLSKLADDEALSPRWRLAADVEATAVDPTRELSERIEELDRLAGAAGAEFPTVRDRAFLAQGELHVQLADQNVDVQANIDEARALFESVVKSDALQDSTHAGALVGLGDCDFAEASRSGSVEGLIAARDSYLRVIVLFPEQSRYVAKALYFGGLCFRQLADLQEDPEAKARARSLMRRLIRDHDGTNWAEEARRYV